MTLKDSIDDRLRSQIEAAGAEGYSTESIDQRIAAALCRDSVFHGALSEADLAVILRGVIYVLFSNHQFMGLDIRPVHNVPKMKVSISNSEAAIKYLVHIHKPITAFLSFSYTLINDAVSVDQKISLKRGSLRYAERTRRLDIRSKAGLAAVNIKEMARRELQDISQVIINTLPGQLEKQAVTGKLERIDLSFDRDRLNIRLEGAFEPVKPSKQQLRNGQLEP